MTPRGVGGGGENGELHLAKTLLHVSVVQLVTFWYIQPPTTLQSSKSPDVDYKIMGSSKSFFLSSLGGLQADLEAHFLCCLTLALRHHHTIGLVIQDVHTSSDIRTITAITTLITGTAEITTIIPNNSGNNNKKLQQQ